MYGDDGVLGNECLARQEAQLGEVVVVAMDVRVVVANGGLDGVGGQSVLLARRQLQVALEEVVAYLQVDQIAHVLALDELRLAGKVLDAEREHVVRVLELATDRLVRVQPELLFRSIKRDKQYISMMSIEVEAGRRGVFLLSRDRRARRRACT